MLISKLTMSHADFISYQRSDEMKQGSILSLTGSSFSSKNSIPGCPFRTKSKRRDGEGLSLLRSVSVTRSAQQCDQMSKLLGENRIAGQSFRETVASNWSIWSWPSSWNTSSYPETSLCKTSETNANRQIEKNTRIAFRNKELQSGNRQTNREGAAKRRIYRRNVIKSFDTSALAVKIDSNCTLNFISRSHYVYTSWLFLLEGGEDGGETAYKPVTAVQECVPTRASVKLFDI